MALPLAWSVGVVVGWGGALCFLLSPFSALALVAPASGGWLGASLSLVVVVACPKGMFAVWIHPLMIFWQHVLVVL